MAELTKWSWVVGVLLAWLAVWLWAWQRHRPQRASAAAQAPAVLVAYASQGGTAAELARLSAQHLQREGADTVQLLPLNAVTDQVLLHTRRALFVASTYGEGEPPDNALAFARRYLGGSSTLDLSHLEFSVLALGDRAYSRFCAFGRQLYQWLEQKGARPVKALLEVDGHQADSPQVLQEWLGSAVELTSPVQNGLWHLHGRQQLNPGSAGNPLYRLQLRSLGALPLWRAGDVFQLVPRNAPQRVTDWLAQRGLDGEQWVAVNGAGQTLAAWLAERQLPDEAVNLDTGSLPEWLAQLPLLPHRDYSIASVPQEREVQLLVRLQRNPAGEPGLGSGWLTQWLAEGGLVTGRIRSNPGFHSVEPARPLILIGSGSGLAGLRAHLAERQQARQPGRAWLILGERSRQHDSLLPDELQHWLAQGVLTRLDRCFSRDGETQRYVQDILRARASELRRWVSEGAAVLVCGSREGMGQAVHTALGEILGIEQVARMLENGDYRRDLY